jgi:ribosome-associated protein
MIQVNDELSIPEHELTFAATRSGGPGGQNVNKVSSRITLSFDVGMSPSLSEEQKKRIKVRLATRINKEGILRVVSQRTRSQEMNREDAVLKFASLLRAALIIQQPRIKTKLPAGAQLRRLEEKKKRTRIKKERSRKEWD